MKQIMIVMFFASLLVINIAACSHDNALRKSKNNYHKNASKVNWHSLEEGLSISENLKKPLLVDFGVEEGCHRCEFIQKNVYANAEILKKINSDFVPIFIDLGKPISSQEIALGEKYDFKNDCLLLFLNHKSEVIRNPEGGEMCFVGRIEPQEFIAYLDHIIMMYNHNITN